MSQPVRLKQPPSVLLNITGFASGFMALSGALHGDQWMPWAWLILGAVNIGLDVLLSARVELDDRRCRDFLRYHQPSGLRFLPIPTMRESAAHIWAELQRAWRRP